MLIIINAPSPIILFKVMDVLLKLSYPCDMFLMNMLFSQILLFIPFIFLDDCL